MSNKEFYIYNGKEYSVAEWTKIVRLKYKKTGICEHIWKKDNPLSNRSTEQDCHCTICGAKQIYMGDD